MNSREIIAVFCLAIVTVSGPAKAKTLPVYDASNFAQMVAQIDAMAEAYQKQIEQLDEAIKQREALTGARNTGDLFNSQLEHQLRTYLPNTWEETLNLINATGLPNGALGTQDIFKDLKDTYDPMTGSAIYSSDPSGPLSQAYDRKLMTTYAALSASEQAFNNISDRIQIYEGLLENLNDSEDLKSSLDLQARITAENGLLLSELVRMNAMMIQQNASAHNESLVSRQRAEKAHTFDAQKAGEAMQLKQ